MVYDPSGISPSLVITTVRPSLHLKLWVLAGAIDDVESVGIEYGFGTGWKGNKGILGDKLLELV